MRLVVDSNVLFTYFWEGSVFKEICDSCKAELFTPELALEELARHASELTKKSGISAAEFKAARKQMVSHITVLDLKDYSKYFRECEAALKALPEDGRRRMQKDLDFIAAARMAACPLWSNDRPLANQNAAIILNTAEVISILG